MRQDSAPCWPAGSSPKDGRGDRHHPQQLDRTLKAMHAGKNTMASAFNRRHAAASPIDKIDQRDAIMKCQIFDESALSTFSARTAKSRSTTHGEVFAPQRDWPAVYFGQPRDIRCRRYRNKTIIGVIAAGPGKRTDLAKTVLIDQFIDPFTYGQPAGFVLTCYRRRAAHFFRLSQAKG